MNKGRLIGTGMTAEVYEWGKDKVLKLFFSGISQKWIKNEAQIGKWVHEAGVPSPAVFGMVEVEKRKGIIFERIAGKTMFGDVQAEPWKLFYYAQKLAKFQYRIHRYRVQKLPSQKERFSLRIKSTYETLGDRTEKILAYLESLPDGSSVCHGDFHFNNIIVSGDRLVPIDWTNAYQGNPLGDVARTCLMMLSPSKPPTIPDILTPMLQYSKWLIFWTYLNEYMGLSKAGFRDIDAWILPAAASKLCDKIPGEEKWLMDIIDKRLKK